MVLVSSQDNDLVFQSYGRCCRREQFFEDFYSVFLGKSDAVRGMFSSTNMTEQRRLLRAGITWLLMYARGAPGGKLHHLGETHSRKGYDVNPALYGLWVEALMESVQRHDPDYSLELDQRWRNVLRPGIEVISGAW
ncbi:MAG: globin [Gammaproteobacteria bacterium HGW-Gammaproteobacteria-14]|nr:MAG: globin [Gammaproteobacteria bacterium HGW-Gammaproteobacteria-14]